jgi:hypothetical protein
MNMKLLSFKPMTNGKWQFDVVNVAGETHKLVFREKADWPVILGMELAKVEKWFFERYALILDFIN